MISCAASRVKVAIASIAAASSLAFGSPTQAASLNSNNATRMAEYLYYSIPKSGQLADWLEDIKMSPGRRAELKALSETLKQKKAKIPSKEWLPGSSFIKVGAGARIYKIGFEKILARRELSVNRVSFSSSSTDEFESIAKKLMQMAAPKEGSSEGLIAVLFYQFGLDEADNCNSPASSSACASKSEAAIIKSLIGEGSTITSFQCEGRKFSAIGLSKPSGSGQERQTIGIAYEYDTKGRAKKASLSVREQVLCNFALSEGRFVSVEDSSPNRGNCDGRPTTEWNGTFHPLQPGDVPKVFALLPIPISRLQGCCADHICRDEIAAAVISAANTTTAAAAP